MSKKAASEQLGHAASNRPDTIITNSALGRLTDCEVFSCRNFRSLFDILRKKLQHKNEVLDVMEKL
jgi:hypothetical protein